MHPENKYDLLPIIVAARDEEKSVGSTLRSFSRAAERLCELYPGKYQIMVILCDNGSKDGTRSQVLSCADSLGTGQFEIVLIDEPKAGKVNALLKAIEHLTLLNLRYSAVVFADAEIQWNSDTLVQLWDYWKTVQGRARLVGTMFARNGTGPERVWESLESVYYIGYGRGIQGHGVFARFVSGMTYLCDPRGLAFFRRIPAEIGNEDIAISYLMGHTRLYICPAARINYTVCNSMKMFFNVKGRHVLECYRLQNWIAKGIFLRLPRRRRHFIAYIHCYVMARKRLSQIVETRTFPVLNGLFMNAGEIASAKRLIAAFILMVPVYSILKCRAWFKLFFGKTNAGWLPYR